MRFSELGAQVVLGVQLSLSVSFRAGGLSLSLTLRVSMIDISLKFVSSV